MSPLVARALVAPIHDAALWAEIGAPFEGGADPEPTDVRDHLLAASVLIARYNRSTSGVVRDTRYTSRPVYMLQAHAPKLPLWIVRRLPPPSTPTPRDPYLDSIHTETVQLLANHPEGSTR